MFRFLFKRTPKPESAASAAPAKIQTPDRAELQRQARDAAIAQAESLSGDEGRAVAFILESEHADARMKAAQYLYAREHLERVRDAMRNVDRRVAKLMQQRLEQLQRQEALTARGIAAAEKAERLVSAPQPMVNQVAELDRDWAALKEVPEAIRQRFDASRERLAQRLQAQAALQRAVLDEVAALQRLRDAHEPLSDEELEQQLTAAEGRMAAHLQSSEAPSLPKNPVLAFQDGVSALRTAMQQRAARREAQAARDAALQGWEEATTADPMQLTEADLRREWAALPALSSEDAAHLQSRFDVLLAQVRAAHKPKETPKPAPARTESRAQPDAESALGFEEALGALEAALEDGSLHAAAEQDRALRGFDLKAIRPTDAQMARLSRLRAELARLQGWARWGGSVSRDELVKAAEDLQGQPMPVAELAKKLGSLRARWKELDTASGAAGKEVWQRFDAACTAAHAPLAEHYQTLAEERRQNLERARAMVAEVREQAQTAGVLGEGVDVDWKALAGFCNRISQNFRRIGPIDRRERKAIDVEFEAALRALTEPLAAQQRHEIERREQLIAEVESLDANSPRSIDALRVIQERWQDMARSLPLARADEQALWQRFRAACDALFAERREAAKVADAERQENLERKNALCAALEAAIDAPVSTLAQTLRATEEAWRGIGPAPRAAQSALDERYANATGALRQRIEAARTQKLEQSAKVLLERLALCRRAEEALISGRTEEGVEAMRADWAALPAASDALGHALQHRFDAALSGDAVASATLEKQRGAVLADILALEILLGVDSPPELAQERLKQQVQVLQSSLGSGQRQQQAQRPRELLLQACSAPARLADQDMARLVRILPLALQAE
ncbi:DUF349 domain-containing protein [Noviherbaspirillum pedocola]|uniref:DUF349 domain-containing protein n=1 Tax=Noviherbaspirillum pedocola TaxID=2801341 RepID=A0A934T1G5_9BURK|nr:DUF349 domain-containing protein [Noviherbaspirillum pedocola]MBK4736964.1 DUF349 domain-containing protein [Noviherbaspirillum pedocola]